MSDEQQAPQQVFSIEKVYVKDLSLEIPNAPQIFLERESPRIDLALHTKSEKVDDSGVFETVVTVTVTAKVGEKTLFLVEVAQAGIFRIQNLPEDQLDPVLAIGCPNILFPYAREVVSDLTTRAGFPPVMLNPVNFEALYRQRAEQQKGEADPAATTH